MFYRLICSALTVQLTSIIFTVLLPSAPRAVLKIFSKLFYCKCTSDSYFFILQPFRQYTTRYDILYVFLPTCMRYHPPVVRYTPTHCVQSSHSRSQRPNSFPCTADHLAHIASSAIFLLINC
ncbi:hypothetical protein BDQ12DRAFT_693790 [Crucibulum laeve]|uniref:Uncharacterized protein n=1 Tax=Crucibulum laeve TaxID=68775 RepID=A0A5C3LHH9_9AGAR|nr:hypothetical protein BDQ12DRAFT_693790 [Crucibulum laeve]